MKSKVVCIMPHHELMLADAGIRDVRHCYIFME